MSRDHTSRHNTSRYNTSRYNTSKDCEATREVQGAVGVSLAASAAAFSAKPEAAT